MREKIFKKHLKVKNVFAMMCPSKRNNLETKMNLNHNELYLAICTRPSGEQIAIHRDGALSIHDSRAVLDDERIVAVLRAEGNFDRADWGVEWSEDQEGFVVDGIEGVFETDDDALRAAVAEFGLTAEIIDDLDRQISA